MSPHGIGPEPAPKVLVKWCHNGFPITRYFDFNENTAEEIASALDVDPPTNDCNPPFP